MRKLLQAASAALLLTSAMAIAAEVTDLSTTDANNTGSTLGMTNSTAPSSVDDVYRNFQGAVARYIADMSSGLTVDTQSTSTAYSKQYDRDVNRRLDAGASNNSRERDFANP